MAIHFDNLPTEKPEGATTRTAGTFKARIVKAEIGKSKTSGNEQLVVSFKTEKGEFVNEYYQEGDSPFAMFKLGQLLLACAVKLQGEGTLKDISKVIINKDVIIDVVINDRGYGSLDYSKDKKGIMPVTTEVAVHTTETNLDPELEQAIETDSDF